MNKDQIIILKDRGLISVSGDDSIDFLQNIITNDITKVKSNNSIFSAILTPQGKYLYEFFIIRSKHGFLLECDNEITSEIIENLNRYKLQSDVLIEDMSEKFVVGVISLEKFDEIKNKENLIGQTISFRDSVCYLDPRKELLGARILSPIEKLYLTIKKFNLKIVEEKIYYDLAFKNGIPIKGLKNLKDRIFGLEANFEEFLAIDFKKGCFVGQENTARMKLKNKLRRRLLPIFTNGKFEVGDSLMFNNTSVGNIIISKPYPFGLIKLFDPNLSDFKDKILNLNGYDAKLSN